MIKKKNKIFIIGYMGTGKSTIAKLLSEKVGLKYVDTDQLIEEKMDMDIKSIFKKYGEKRFRKEEYKLLKKLSKEHNIIISCGGGMPCSDENITHMIEEGKVVWIKSSIEQIIRRVMGDSTRPLIGNTTKTGLKKKISKHLKERVKYYSQATIKVWNRGEAIETVERLISYLKKHDQGFL